MIMNLRKFLLCFLILLSLDAYATKCDSGITEKKLEFSKNVVYIKVTSLTLIEFKDETNSSKVGISVGYELIENLWGPKRKPEILFKNDLKRYYLYPGQKYVLAIPRGTRSTVEGLVGECTGTVYIDDSDSAPTTTEIKRTIHEYIKKSS